MSDNRVNVKVVKTVTRGLISGSTSGASFYSFAFTLADLPEYASFTNLYDQYRIVKIQCLFMPLTLLQTAGTSVVTSSALVVIADYDDNSSLTTMAQLYNYQNVQFCKCQDKLEFAIRPRIAMAAYSGSFTSYANLSPQWIDTNSTAVQHYGIKCGIDQSTQIPSWVFYARYFLEFRAVR